jgi:hypothetical protein
MSAVALNSALNAAVVAAESRATISKLVTTSRSESEASVPTDVPRRPTTATRAPKRLRWSKSLLLTVVLGSGLETGPVSGLSPSTTSGTPSTHREPLSGVLGVLASVAGANRAEPGPVRMHLCAQMRDRDVRELGELALNLRPRGRRAEKAERG